MTIPARLNQLLPHLPGSNVAEKATLLGVSTPTLYSYLAGKTRLSEHFLINLNTIARVNTNWLLTGDGSPFASSLHFHAPLFKAIFTAAAPRLAGLPHDAQAEIIARIYTLLAADPDCACPAPDQSRLARRIKNALALAIHDPA